MTRVVRVLVAIAFALGIAAPLRAAEPPHYKFATAPPGSIVQSQLVYLSGEGMQSQWRAVISKQNVGSSGHRSYYQWYVSIYQIDYDTATYHLRYQSPANGGPLDKVEKGATSDAPWFPMQSVSIVGVAELMHPGVQNLVVASHQAGADCGSADLTIFATDRAGKVVPAATVENGCALQATIVHGSSLDTLQLSGPYYDKKAAMCCPTKNHAIATLKYVNGKWVESPNYFKLYPKSFPHP